MASKKEKYATPNTVAEVPDCEGSFKEVFTLTSQLLYSAGKEIREKAKNIENS